jgi:hypothetical protein
MNILNRGCERPAFRDPPTGAGPLPLREPASVLGGNFILNVKHERPSWCARKIRERLLSIFRNSNSSQKRDPCVRDGHGLVERRGRVPSLVGTPQSITLFRSFSFGGSAIQSNPIRPPMPDEQTDDSDSDFGGGDDSSLS